MFGKIVSVFVAGLAVASAYTTPVRPLPRAFHAPFLLLVDFVANNTLPDQRSSG